MIEVLAPGSRLNSDVIILIAYIPHFVVEMTNMAAAVVGGVFAHNRTTFYATDIIELYSVFACPISFLHAVAATAPAVTINIYKQYFYANNPL